MDFIDSMEDMDLVFLTLQVKANIITALKLGEKTNFSDAMVLLYTLEQELERRGVPMYGPDFIRMSQED